MDILDYTGTKFINSPIDLPTIGGNSGEKGKTGVIVQLWIGGKLFEVPVDPKTGLFSWTATEPFPDGDYSVSIRTLDRAGNLGKPTLRTLRIDTTPPNAPELLNLYDDVGGKMGSFDPGQTTDDKRPKLTGIAQEGTLVYLRDADGNTIGSARADEVTGKWVMDPDKDLEEGVNNLVLVAEETFGGVTREGAPSEPFSIIVQGGTLPPDNLTITHAIDDVGSATGELSNGALTDDTIPELRGAAPADSTVIIYYRLAGSDTWLGSSNATLTGESWSWVPGSALEAGNYEFQASIGDTASALFNLEIATPAGIIARTRIESARDDFGLDHGPLNNGAITDDATPTLQGRAEANALVVVRYMLDGTTAASVVVNADSAGKWSWTPPAELATGVWLFDVQPKGASTWSSVFKLEITGTGENSYAPTISYAFDDVGISKGERGSGSITDDTTPTLHGKATANSVVYLQAINGEEVQTFSVKADSSSNWTWTPPNALALGEWQFQVSKGADEGWDKKFHLTISDQNYSQQLNFEGALLGPLDEKQVQESLPNFYGTLLTHGGFNNPPSQIAEGIEIAQSPNVAIAKGVFGENALKVNKNTFLKLEMSKEDNNNHLIDNFSFQTLNAAVNNRISFEVIIAGTGGDKVKSFIMPANSLLTITREDFGLPDTFFIDKIIIQMPLGQSTPLYMDNFKWTTVYDKFNSLPETEEENTVNHLDNIDALTTDGVTGHEAQADTLKLTGKDNLLDLTDATNKLESIEIFDITGTGDNTLKLDLNALLQHGEKDLFIEDGKTQLMVSGNEGDVVQLVDILPEGSDISEWKHQEGTVTVAGVEYNVYSHGDDAELLVQQGVKTELI